VARPLRKLANHTHPGLPPAAPFWLCVPAGPPFTNQSPCLREDPEHRSYSPVLIVVMTFADNPASSPL